MKTVTDDGKWWLEDYPDGVLVGFTAEHLRELGCLWNLIPRIKNDVRVGIPFAGVESSRCLGPLNSPVDGTIVVWNEKFLDVPDKINPIDFLIKVKK